MYNDLDKRSETYTFKATNSDGGEAKDPMVISIGMKYKGNIKELNGIHPQRFELLGLLAHELGHTIRGLYGKDPKEPIEEERTSIKEDYTRKNNYAKDYVNYHEVTEKGAMHIENVVRGELQKVHRYQRITINRWYSPSFTLNMERKDGKIKYTASMGLGYDLFENGRTEKMYLQKNNIYEEMGVIPNYSKLVEGLQPKPM